MRIRVPSYLDQPAVPIRRGARVLRQALAYLGPGFFVTVGFIDPGNWATNIAAGSMFDYDLLWVVALGTAILILWQHMSAHLGTVTGKCLAEAVPANMNKASALLYGSTAMAACVATALAEILGAAIGLKLLLRIPIPIGVWITAAFVILTTWRQGHGSLERAIVGFVSLIGLCYLIELYLVKPDWSAAAYHLIVPTLSSGSILVAIGVLGAVVMPHNMYLHSEVIQNREWKGKSEAETRHLLRFEFLDTLVAMLVGMAINAAMIIVAAAAFHRHGVLVNDLAQSSETLKPLVGQLASVVFGAGLLVAGVASAMTAAIAGGTVFSGYMGNETEIGSPSFRWGMLLTILPASLVIMAVRHTLHALVISQVCLSIQLPLTMLPLYLLTRSRRVMGSYAIGGLEAAAMVVSGLAVVALNGLLVYQLLGGSF
jgi:manganese transport protein